MKAMWSKSRASSRAAVLTSLKQRLNVVKLRARTRLIRLKTHFRIGFPIRNVN